MRFRTKITSLFGIDYPIIQAGMIWASGRKLATAASNAGVLGLIGAGSMKPELLREHIQKTREGTSKPFGVNVPLLRGDVADLVRVTIEEEVRIIFSSAGHPGKFIDQWKKAGCIIVHVVPSVKHALKAESVGCDAVVAEGFEAGGHNGSDEITTLCLIPQVVDTVGIPVIAAGGIADGRGVLAAFALGADGVQIGTRFAATHESSAAERYKELVVDATDTGTVLTMKKLAPVRMLKTPFTLAALAMEQAGATKEELAELLGRKRERLGIFEGDFDKGQFEAGQSSGLVHEILSAAEVVDRLLDQCKEAFKHLDDLMVKG